MEVPLYFYYILYRNYFKQTVLTLILRRIVQHLIGSALFAYVPKVGFQVKETGLLNIPY